MASTEVEHYNGVDVAEVPSAAWGWSRINRRTWHVTGAFAVVFLLRCSPSNHVGRVEDVYLVRVCGAWRFFVLVRDVWGRPARARLR